jgi:hypothetical protein
MKQTLSLVLVISASVLLAQDNNAPKGPSQNNTKPATEQTVVAGVSAGSTEISFSWSRTQR